MSFLDPLLEVRATLAQPERRGADVASSSAPRSMTPSSVV
jgi:hypothetical protein